MNFLFLNHLSKLKGSVVIISLKHGLKLGIFLVSRQMIFLGRIQLSTSVEIKHKHSFENTWFKCFGFISVFDSFFRIYVIWVHFFSKFRKSFRRFGSRVIVCHRIEWYLIDFDNFKSLSTLFIVTLLFGDITLLSPLPSGDLLVSE